MRWQRHLATLVASALITAFLLTPALDPIEGFGLDALFWMRSKVFGIRHPPESAPTVVIAIDEDTYRHPPFRDIPLALWTPYLAKLMNALLDADTKVIGFDVIFSTSAQRFLPGHDREFLLAQRRAATEKKLVLAKIQHSERPIAPFPGYAFAAGGQNIKIANLFTDRDGVIRRVPLVLEGLNAEGQIQLETGFAMEIAQRAVGAPVSVKGKQVWLGDRLIASDIKSGALVNFDAGNPTPTFSLADMFACVAAGKSDFLKAHFSGKVVLVGAVLDVEDRKLTSRRFIVEPEGSYPMPRCVLPLNQTEAQASYLRPNIAGVYIHSQAINDMIRGDTLLMAGPLTTTLVIFLSAMGAGLAAFHLSLFRVGLAILAATAAWAIVATIAFNLGLVLPLVDPLVGGVLAYILLISYRIVVTDRTKRQLRRAFSLYLPDSVIDHMIETDKVPALGGEEREITVWFSDIEGFTRAAEQQGAQEVVNGLNRYFSTMVEVIESHGGYVDKFVGDGIVALFGAPMILPDNATAALKAAEACQKRLSQIAAGGAFKTRIGLHTGAAVIGNIGSPNRFNYTAMGDTVNLAARLESANKAFATSVLLSEATWILAGRPLSVRKIGRVKVAGRREPITVYSLPLENAGAQSRERFDEAIILAEKHQYSESLAIFSELAREDAAAARWMERLQAHLSGTAGDKEDLAVELSEK